MPRNDERYLLHALEFEASLRACLRRYTRNDSDIDELLQEVHARLLIAGASPAPEVRSVRAFALTVAHEVGRDWLREHDGVPMERMEDPAMFADPDAGEQLDAGSPRAPELATLVSAIQGLPDLCRQVFTLRKVYGYSQKEIALRLNMSEDGVERNLTAAARWCAHVVFENPASERSVMLFDRVRRLKRSDVQRQ